MENHHFWPKNVEIVRFFQNEIFFSKLFTFFRFWKKWKSFAAKILFFRKTFWAYGSLKFHFLKILCFFISVFSCNFVRTLGGPVTRSWNFRNFLFFLENAHFSNIFEIIFAFFSKNEYFSKNFNPWSLRHTKISVFPKYLFLK